MKDKRLNVRLLFCHSCRPTNMLIKLTDQFYKSKDKKVVIIQWCSIIILEKAST